MIISGRQAFGTRTIGSMRQLLIPILLLLTACGFHLRGAVQLPPELSELAVVDARPATDIAPELRRGLKNTGVQVSDSATRVLQLKAEQYGKRVLSVDKSGRAQEYGLSYTVRFALTGAAGAVWLPEAAVTQTRDLRFDAAAVLGTEGEERQLKAEMRQEAVLQILRRLQAAKPPVADQKTSPLPSQETGQEVK
jgi:LPS-assembly lipoprotein